ncbi:MAG: hypothetical protein WAN46_10925 [Gammaproteobacteria bacterium]
MNRERLARLFLRGIIWGMVGFIVAPLVIGFWDIALFLGFAGWALIPAVALAGAAGAAFYGSMPIALVATITGILASTVHLAFAEGTVRLLSVALVASGAGALVGGILQFPLRFSRGVPAKVAAGFSAGAGGGVLIALIDWLYRTALGTVLIAGLSVALTGFIYALTELWWVRHLGQLLSRSVVEVLVSALLAGIAGGAIWLLGGPIMDAIEPAHKELITQMLEHLPSALVGGVIGGALMGLLMEQLWFAQGDKNV